VKEQAVHTVCWHHIVHDSNQQHSNQWQGWAFSSETSIWFYHISSFDCCSQDVVQPREFAFQKLVAAGKYRVLFSGANSAARLFAVSRVKCIRDVHSFDNLGDRNEGFLVVRRGIISQVDEHLRRSAIRILESKHECAASV